MICLQLVALKMMKQMSSTESEEQTYYHMGFCIAASKLEFPMVVHSCFVSRNHSKLKE